jgi:transglutaminase/protease-like cytokinesis protein 3
VKKSLAHSFLKIMAASAAVWVVWVSNSTRADDVAAVSPAASTSLSPSPSPSASSSAPSANCTSYSYTPQAYQTSNSSYILTTTLPDDTQGILVSVQKKGDSSQPEDSAGPATGGAFYHELYIRGGKGDYIVTLFAANSIGVHTTYQGLCDVEIDNSDARDVEFLVPSLEVQSDDSGIIALAHSIITNAHANTDREKSIAIHNWVTTHIVYDTIDTNPPAPDAVSTLHRKIGAVCEGYSSLNAALHRAVGIPAQVIAGNAQQDDPSKLNCDTPAGPNTGADHAWNKILIDGQWLIQDTTWDAGAVDEDTGKFVAEPVTDYLFPDPAKFAVDHLQCLVRQI